MPRFFITASNIFGGIAYLSAQDMEHLNVLRIRRGEVFTVCDSNGTDYTCRMNENTPTDTSVEIIGSAPSAGEPKLRCTVYAAYSKGDKIDTVIQKCVELGACEINVFPSSRCVSRPNELTLVKKLLRWQRIAEEAAKQSERGIIPLVSASTSYADALASAAKADLPLFMYENEQDLGVASALKDRTDCKTVSIMTGPEGGFSQEESDRAVAAGMISVSLGKRILRCETAPLAALSAVMCLTGNLGG